MARFRGAIRGLDSLGRIVIPKDLLQQMAIPDRAVFEITATADMIVLRQHNPDSKEILMSALDEMAKATGEDINAYLERARGEKKDG